MLLLGDEADLRFLPAFAISMTGVTITITMATLFIFFTVIQVDDLVCSYKIENEIDIFSSRERPNIK